MFETAVTMRSRQYFENAVMPSLNEGSTGAVA